MESLNMCTGIPQNDARSPEVHLHESIQVPKRHTHRRLYLEAIAFAPFPPGLLRSVLRVFSPRLRLVFQTVYNRP